MTAYLSLSLCSWPVGAANSKIQRTAHGLELSLQSSALCINLCSEAGIVELGLTVSGRLL